MVAALPVTPLQRELTMAIPSGMHLSGTTQLSQVGGSLSVALPAAIVERCGLAPGTEIEVYLGDDGIYLRPIGIEPWFSVEWEQALATVLEYHGEVIEAIGN